MLFTDSVLSENEAMLLSEKWTTPLIQITLGSRLLTLD